MSKTDFPFDFAAQLAKIKPVAIAVRHLNVDAEIAMQARSKFVSADIVGLIEDMTNCFEHADNGLFKDRDFWLGEAMKNARLLKEKWIEETV